MANCSPNGQLPTELNLWPVLQVGAFTGTSGLIVGGVSGLIKSSSPALFAITSGVQWFALGTAFWASRGAVLHVWGVDKSTPKEKAYASGIAGAFSGGVVGLLIRGRANVLPGAAMFSIFGLAGQSLYNFADGRHSRSQEMVPNDPRKESIWERLANSKWSPVGVLSDEKYEQMLKDKLLRVNAEIALIDEDIEKLKKEAEKWKDTSADR